MSNTVKGLRSADLTNEVNLFRATLHAVANEIADIVGDLKSTYHINDEACETAVERVRELVSEFNRRLADNVPDVESVEPPASLEPSEYQLHGGDAPG
jgi:hypothetical protein